MSAAEIVSKLNFHLQQVAYLVVEGRKLGINIHYSTYTRTGIPMIVLEGDKGKPLPNVTL